MNQSAPEQSSAAPAPATGSKPPAGAAAEGAPHPSLDALPDVRTSLDPTAILSRLDALARRGKLAGFTPGHGDALFEAACFGEPFDRVLLARAAREDGGTVLRFSTRLRRRVPAIFVAVTILTIWPGVWLTDSMLTTYFSWYTIPTWWWYIPLTVVPLFWMVPRMIRKSEGVCRESAAHQIAMIRESLPEH